MKRPSGRFVIRMPEALHRRLREEAMRTGRSLNQLCVARLSAGGESLVGTGAVTAHAGILPSDFLDEVVRRWLGKLVGLILFGSSARGDATEDSDTDLLLVMRPGMKIERGLYRLWDEFRREDSGAEDSGKISPHFVILPGSVLEAGGLWYEAALDGIVLWEIDSQVSRFLGSVREAMGQGKIRRRLLHGSPYWIKEYQESDA
jgi:hypothetical protein